MAAVLFRANERIFFIRTEYCWTMLLQTFLLFLEGYIKHYSFDTLNSHFQILKKKKKNIYHRKIHSCPRFYHVTNSMLSEIIKDSNFNDLGVFGIKKY